MSKHTDTLEGQGGIPTFSSLREQGKSKEAILEELQGLSFAQEIKRDVEATKVMLGRTEAAKAKYGHNSPQAKQEAAAANLYKRALMLAGASGMRVHNGIEHKSAAANGIPVSSYLTHGTRMMIEIPVGSDNKLFNWLTSGNAVDGTTLTTRPASPQQALKGGGAVYNRSAATHGVDISSGQAVEQKGFLIGAKDFIWNQLGKETKHWGADLAFNATFEGKDSEGKQVDEPDGDHGHLYIYYMPATDDKPGALLIGNEVSAPTSHKHSKIGTSGALSPTDCSKFRVLEIKCKIAGEAEYENTLIPQQCNGLIAKPSAKAIEQIIQMKAENFGYEIADMLPEDNPEEFQNNRRIHVAPREAKPKSLGDPTSWGSLDEPNKPSLFKRIANVCTIGLAYSEECQNYAKYALDLSTPKKPNFLKAVANFCTKGSAYQQEFQNYKKYQKAIKAYNIQDKVHATYSQSHPKKLAEEQISPLSRLKANHIRIKLNQASSAIGTLHNRAKRRVSNGRSVRG